MKGLICALLVVLVLSVSASALFETNSLQSYVDRYNANIDKAPTILKSLLGNEKVEFNILLVNDSILTVGMQTDKGRIASTVDGGFANPSIEVETSEETIERIIKANDPITAFGDARDSGDLVITGNTLTTRLKLASVLSSMDVLRFLAGSLLG
ncbi:MAG: hypothetical protein GKC10_00920 [Methanosarcinales archaeon]|nr:hypothetical protein [Methanosarcinales archaeon]